MNSFLLRRHSLALIGWFESLFPDLFVPNFRSVELFKVAHLLLFDERKLSMLLLYILYLAVDHKPLKKYIGNI